MYVSAKYTDPSLSTVTAVDARGIEWHIPADSQVGDWLRYLEDGGTIDNYVEPPSPPIDPVTSRRARLALYYAGITEDMVDAALAENPAGMIEWKHATEFERNHPLIEALGATFNLSAEQIDELFIAAKDL